MLDRVKQLARRVVEQLSANVLNQVVHHLQEVQAHGAVLQQSLARLDEAQRVALEQSLARTDQAIARLMVLGEEARQLVESRDARRRLDALALAMRSRARLDGARRTALLQLAGHYGTCAGLIGRQNLLGNARPPKDAPDDDGSLTYSNSVNVFVPGNEAEVPADAASYPWTDMMVDPDCGKFLVLGQSNAGNHGAVRHVSAGEVYNLNFLDMRCSLAADPLGGASGQGGSVWSRLGDRLIAEGLYRRVLFVPLAFGGSFVQDWIPGGTLNRRLAFALGRMRRWMGEGLLEFTAAIWQQGEAEANHTTMLAADYRQRVHEALASLREHRVFSPAFISLSTICESGTQSTNNHAEIRKGQQALPDPARGILAGPDTDRITGSGRSDGCHLSAEGLDACADMWFEILRDSKALLP